MASVKMQDIPQTAKFMSALWELAKEFWIPEDNPAYWESLAARVDQISEQYPGQFEEEMLLAYVRYLEKKHKGRSKDGNHA